jgi:CO/xanthine dehydrogenase Mo-binding subunit
MAGGSGGVQTNQYVHLQGTIYQIRAVALHIRAVLTNTTPIGVTRAPGFAESVNIMERLIDRAARQCGFGPADLRRRNMAPAEAMPMTNALGFVVDSGHFAETFDRALRHADIAGFAARRADSEARGFLRGLGFAYHIKGTGGSPHENVDIRFESDGAVSLITGAADALEAAEEDITFEDGRFVVAGTNLSMPLLAVAARARETGAPLDTYHAWTREAMTFPNGTHVVEVDIDRGTGLVALVRHTAVDDYGVLVNPMIAAGQAHGAIAQGAGQALLEHAVYDARSAQPVGSFMDYALPRADDFPPFHLDFNGTRCTTNPLGVKGCGEAAAVAIFPAIGNAIADALAPFGAVDFNGPATPFRTWQAMRDSNRQG